MMKTPRWKKPVDLNYARPGGCPQCQGNLYKIVGGKEMLWKCGACDYKRVA